MMMRITSESGLRRVVTHWQAPAVIIIIVSRQVRCQRQGSQSRPAGGPGSAGDSSDSEIRAGVARPAADSRPRLAAGSGRAPRP